MERGNVILTGSTPGPASNETNRAAVLPENILGQMEQLRRVMPGLAQVNILRVCSGVESYFSDDMPVMAELIATGTTATPIAPYHIGPFAGR